MATEKLTPKQARFVEEYRIDRNATQAAIRAGYSEKTAYAIGSENLTKPEILAEIDKGTAALSEELQLTTKMVVEGLFTEAKLAGEGSSASARVAAWGLLGKHLKMFTEKHEHSGAVVLTLEQMVVASLKPKEEG